MAAAPDDGDAGAYAVAAAGRIVERVRRSAASRSSGAARRGDWA